jgi:hypothetical protein
MNEDINILIERKENEFAPLRQRMEELKKQFITQTISCASDWYRKTTKRIRNKVPSSHLKYERRKNRQYESRSLRVCAKLRKNRQGGELENPALWWHQRLSVHDSIEQSYRVAINTLKSLTAP